MDAGPTKHQAFVGERSSRRVVTVAVRRMLFHSRDIKGAQRSVEAAGGRALIYLSPSLLVAEVPNSLDPSSVDALLIDDGNVDALSADDAQHARAWLESDRIGKGAPSKRLGAGQPWDTPGYEPP